MRTRSHLSLLLSGAIVATVLGLAGPAHALQCGMRLVEVGDSELYVRSVCGEPDSAMTRTETRTQTAFYPYGGTVPGPVYGSSVSVSVQIDTWIYDFGRTRFMEQLTFENGVLRDSRPLGYGTGRDHHRHGALDRPVRHGRDVADRRRA